MPGKIWSEEDLEFLCTHYAEKGPKWCAERLERTPRGVTVKALRLDLHYTAVKTRYKPDRPAEDADLGPEAPTLGHHCVDCGCLSPDYRCPECRRRYLARYHGACWGPTADETYGVGAGA